MRSRSLPLGLPMALLLAPLAAPLFFASPAEAAIGPPCCQPEAETHPPDPHREPGPIFVAAKVQRPEERALEATAEAPVTADAPLVDAIGIPLEPVGEERRGVSEPAVVPVPMLASELQALQEDIGVNGPPCCQVEAEEAHPDPKTPAPILVSAKVRNREERALEAAAEAQIQTAIQLVNAIGIPLDAERGVSEPAHVPVVAAKPPPFDDLSGCCTVPEADNPDDRAPITVDAPWAWLRAMRAKAEIVVLALLLVLANGLLRRWPRRRVLLEDQPAPPTRPLPDELPQGKRQADIAPLPQPEPEVARAKAREAERELEPA